MSEREASTKKPGKKSDKKKKAPVHGASEIKRLPGPFSSKVVKLIEENALDMVENAVRKANAGDYRATKYLFELLERFESQVPPERRNSVAKVLLKHLGLTEGMIAAEQAAAEAEEDEPAQEATENRVE